MYLRRTVNWTCLFCLSWAGSMAGCDETEVADVRGLKPLAVKSVQWDMTPIFEPSVSSKNVDSSVPPKNPIVVRILDPDYWKSIDLKEPADSVSPPSKSTHFMSIPKSHSNALNLAINAQTTFSKGGAALLNPQFIRICRTYSY